MMAQRFACEAVQSLPIGADPKCASVVGVGCARAYGFRAGESKAFSSFVNAEDAVAARHYHNIPLRCFAQVRDGFGRYVRNADVLVIPVFLKKSRIRADPKPPAAVTEQRLNEITASEMCDADPLGAQIQAVESEERAGIQAVVVKGQTFDVA